MRKSTLLLIGIFVALLSINLEAQTLPKTGAALRASENSLELVPGQSMAVDITRMRSKAYRKANFGSIKVNTPEGVESTITKDEINPDSFNVLIETEKDLSNGKYTIVIQGEGRNASKVKATMLSLTVDSKNLAKSNQQ